MFASELADFLSSALNVKNGTVYNRVKDLRAAGLLTVGKQGPHAGARMTSADAINLVLANLLDHERGDKVAENVRRVRNLPIAEFIELPAGLTDGLSCCVAKTTGDALDSLLNDLRMGTFDRWSAGEAASGTIQFDSSGLQFLFLITKPKRWDLDFRSATIAFGPRLDKWLLRRFVNLDFDLFRQLAEALGPPDD